MPTQKHHTYIFERQPKVDFDRMFSFVYFQTLPIYPHISPHGGKTKWPATAISSQCLCDVFNPLHKKHFDVREPNLSSQA